MACDVLKRSEWTRVVEHVWSLRGVGKDLGAMRWRTVPSLRVLASGTKRVVWGSGTHNFDYLYIFLSAFHSGTGKCVLP